MTNAVKGEAVLKLADGRELTLVLDFEAFVSAESAYGKPIAQLTVDARAGFIGALRAMLFGALRAHHSDIDVRGAGEIMQADAAAADAAMEAAARRAYPDADPEGDKEPGKARPPRGKASGGNGAKSAKTTKPSGGKPRARSR